MSKLGIEACCIVNFYNLDAPGFNHELVEKNCFFCCCNLIHSAINHETHRGTERCMGEHFRPIEPQMDLPFARSNRYFAGNNFVTSRPILICFRPKQYAEGCLFVRSFVCLFVCLFWFVCFVCLFVCFVLFVCLFVHLFVNLFNVGFNIIII
jgi:hypothetical protein